MKLFKNVVKLYMAHIASVFLSLALVFVFTGLTNYYPFVFSTITTIIYIIIMYSVAWNIGRLDSRNIPGFFPDKKLMLNSSFWLALGAIILLFIRLVEPDAFETSLPFLNKDTEFFLQGCYISGIPDFFYRIWNFPFAAFVPCDNILAYFIVLIVPPVIVNIAYRVGLRRFSIREFLYVKLVFVPRNKRDKENEE